MSYVTDLLERERELLCSTGDEATLNHVSIKATPLPAARIYPVAPAQGRLAASASAVWHTAVPGGRAIARKVSALLPAGVTGVADDDGADGDAAAADSRATAASRRAIAQRACPDVDASRVVVAAATTTMLETFLLQVGLRPGTRVLVPGLLLAPHHKLLDVLCSFKADIAGFDYDVDTMTADVAAMRAALTSGSSNQHSDKASDRGSAAAKRPATASAGLILLVGVKGRFFSNAAAIVALAAELGCAVVTVRPPLAAPTAAPGPVALSITALDGLGSFGGAVAHTADAELAAAMRAATRKLPAPGWGQSWLRAARHFLSVLLSHRFDYGTTVWLLALLSRAATGAADLAAFAAHAAGVAEGADPRPPHATPAAAAAIDHVARAVKGATAERHAAPKTENIGRSSSSSSSSKSSGRAAQKLSAADATAPTAMDAARQRAMDLLNEWVAGGDGYAPDTDHTPPWMGVAVGAARDVAGAAAAGATALLRKTAAGAGLLPESLVNAAAAAAESVSQKAGQQQQQKPRFTRVSVVGAAAPESTRPSDAMLRWVGELLRDQEQFRDAQVLCLWYFLWCLPSYVRVASATPQQPAAGESKDGATPPPPESPLDCVEASLASVVLRARCPALIARRLQQAGFAALPPNAVAFNPAAPRSLAGVAAANGVVYIADCRQCSAAATQLCIVPLSPAIAAGDLQLLLDIISEVPRQWHCESRQPIATPTTGNFRRTDGRNVSNADRPYNTATVRSLLVEVAQRHSSITIKTAGGGNSAAAAAEGGNEEALDVLVRSAMAKMARRPHPVMTYLLYGSQATRMILPKL